MNIHVHMYRRHMVYLMKSYYSIYSLVLAEPELPFVVELEYDDDCNSSFVVIVEMAKKCKNYISRFSQIFINELERNFKFVANFNLDP